MANMPVVGHGSDEAVFYHQGSLAGYTSSVFLLPDTESAIVVLTNSISLNDCANWVGQLILETVVGTNQPNDYQGYAQESSDNHLAKFTLMQKSLDERRDKYTSPKPLKAYIGRYYNAIVGFNIKISVQPGTENIELAFQGLDSQVWELRHYHYDTFIWLMSRDEAVQPRFPYSPEKLYKIEFVAESDGKMSSLLWAHDLDSPPEKFVRSDRDLSACKSEFRSFVKPALA